MIWLNCDTVAFRNSGFQAGEYPRGWDITGTELDLSRVVQHRNRTQVDIGRGKFLDQRVQGAGRSPAYPRLWYPRSPSCEGRPACCLPAPRRGGAARSSAGSRPASTTAAAPIRCAPRSTPPSFCPTRLFHFVPTASPRNSDLRAVTQLPINPFMLPSEPLTRGKT